jgi:hypothetical protein
MKPEQDYCAQCGLELRVAFHKGYAIAGCPVHGFVRALDDEGNGREFHDAVVSGMNAALGLPSDMDAADTLALAKRRAAKQPK